MFDFNKIEDFDRHIALSIPSYLDLLRMTRSISQYFMFKGCNVYDVGCSTGNLLRSMNKVEGVNYIGIDNSSLIPNDSDTCTFIKDDFFNYEMKNASFISSIFTAQFTDMSKRAEFYNKINGALVANGAFLIAEKTYCNDGKIQDIVNSSYYECKSDNFSSDEILNKELSLRENLKPDRYSVLKSFLSEIGEAQEVWRCFNFVAFLVVKGNGAAQK